MILIHQDITELIIKSYFKVYNELGYGFLEKVYENAMMIEMCNQGLKCIQQPELNVYYEDEVVGKYNADIIVERCVILELKAADSIREEHKCQLINYLKATNIKVGLLLNFGKKPEFCRKIFDKGVEYYLSDFLT